MANIIRYLTIEDLAKRYDKPVSTIKGWNRTGVGPEYIRLPRGICYRPEDVAAWEDSRTVPGAPRPSIRECLNVPA